MPDTILGTEAVERNSIFSLHGAYHLVPEMGNLQKNWYAEADRDPYQKDGML